MSLYVHNNALLVADGGLAISENCCTCCVCPDFLGYCSDIEWTGVPPGVPGQGMRDGDLQGLGDLFFSDDGITFTITCDAGADVIALTAFTTRLCPFGQTTLGFVKYLQFCDDLSAILGTHTLEPFVDCAGCDCGAITWTLREAPC